MISDLSASVWIWGCFTLLLTAAVGFATGMCYARSTARWSLRRAEKHFAAFFTALIKTLDAAQEACAVLERAPHMGLSDDQLERFDRTRRRLVETVDRVIDARQPGLPSAAATDRPSTSRRPQLPAGELNWVLAPEDDTTGLPDRSALDLNLSALLELGSQHEVASGLLLLEVDKFEQLTSRFGHAGAAKLLRQFARIVLRACRDEDVVCRSTGATLAVLMPDVDADSARRLADAIRNTVREYRFRLDEVGPEVLVTASFGLTACPPGDSPELAWNRAAVALSESRRRGRNQLHVHHGAVAGSCLAGA